MVEKDSEGVCESESESVWERERERERERESEWVREIKSFRSQKFENLKKWNIYADFLARKGKPVHQLKLN